MAFGKSEILEKDGHAYFDGQEEKDQAGLNSPHRRRFLKYAVFGTIGLLGCCTLLNHHRWRYIVVHHSAGHYGNAAFLKKVHRQRQPYDPIDSMAYHFVIGNGNGLEIGRVEEGFRWRSQLWGAHVSVRNKRFNLSGIGICLVGNYHVDHLRDSQYEGLITLVRRLRQAYAIPLSRVYTHGRLPGERTVCPGQYFPYARFRRDIA